MDTGIPENGKMINTMVKVSYNLQTVRSWLEPSNGAKLMVFAKGLTVKVLNFL